MEYPGTFPPTALAPMVDGSDAPFRLLCHRHGCGITYTPMYNVALTSTNREPLCALCEELRTWKSVCRPLAVQLSGRDPELFSRTYQELPSDCFDLVDVNLGCPQTVAARGKYGAYLMDEPDTARRIVEALAAVASHPIGVKTRLSGSVEETVRFIVPLLDAGARVLTLHGRRRSQRTGYNVGPPNWADVGEVFRRLRAERPGLRLTLVANGGVWCEEAHRECLRVTGADATMAGTYIMMDPALYEGCASSQGQGGPQLAGENPGPLDDLQNPAPGETTDLSGGLSFSYALPPASQLLPAEYTQHPLAADLPRSQPSWPARWEEVMRSCVSFNGEKVVSRLTDDVVARGRRLRLALEFLRSCEECSASPTTERAALAAVLPHIMHMCGPDLLRANTDLRDLLVRAKDHHKVRRAGRQYLFDCGVVIRELARRLDEGLGFVGTGNKGASGRGGAGQAAGEPGARP